MADLNKTPSVGDVFGEAIRRAPGEAREAYLEQACGGDSKIRQRVERMLQASEEADSFLEFPATDFDSSMNLTVAEKPGDVIGAFKLLQQIGEGGFGIVYMAQQLRPVKRKVALKIIKPGMDTKEVVGRFDAERQAMALMDHSNIAQVFDGGTTDSGRPYFVMELVKGAALTDFCDTNRLTMRRRLELFGQVCRAIQHAHQKGVIHRDIKPTNVMVTLHDGKPVPKIIDFGIAKAIGHELTERTMFTAYGQMIGTPQYMSPEQAEMSGLDVDTRSDVYSLGVLLYELVTGTTPLEKQAIQHTAYHELLRQIREVEAPKPSARISTLKDAQQSTIAEHRQIEPIHLRRLLQGDLDRVVLKALAKDREQRYESPKDLAADIERFLDDKPVQAIPPSPLYLARKFTRRHRPVIFSAAAIISFLILSTAVSVWLAIRATRAESEVTQTAEELRRSLYVANMQLADQLWNRPDGNPREIDELLVPWIPVDNEQEDLREFSWRYQWTRLHLAALQAVLDVDAVALSSSGNLVTANSEGIVEWNHHGQSASRRWDGDASQAVLSACGHWAIIPKSDGSELIEIQHGRPLRQLPGERHAFAPTARFIGYWRHDELRLQAINSGDEIALTSLDAAGITAQSHQPDFTLAADGKSYMLRNIKDVAAILNGRETPVTWRHINLIGSFAWSPDGQLLAVGNMDGKIEIRWFSRPEHPLTIGTHGKQIEVIAFSADSTRLASGGGDGTIDIWDLSLLNADLSVAENPLVRQLKAHVDKIQSLVFSSDGSKLASLDEAGVAKLWSLDEPDTNQFEIEKLTKDFYSGRIGLEWDMTGEGACVAYVIPASPAEETGMIELGDRIIGVSDDANSRVRDVSSLDEMQVLEQIEIGPFGSSVRLHMERGDGRERFHVDVVRNMKRNSWYRLAFAPDGESLTVAGYRVGATRWTATGQEMRRFPALGPSVAYSPDDRFLALTAGANVQLWDRQSDRLHAKLDARVGGTSIPTNRRGGSLAFSPDSRYLAIGTCFPFHHEPKRSDLRVWEVASLKEIGSPLHRNDHVLASVLFSPDGTSLVALDHSGLVRIWNTSNWELERVLEVENVHRQHELHQGPDWELEFIAKTHAMDISPDGEMLAIGFGTYGGPETGIVLLNFISGKPLRIIPGPLTYGLTFSPDGKTLVSTGGDHKVTLYDVATGEQLRTLRGHNSIVCAVDFSSDGNALATADMDHDLRIWKATSFDEIDRHPLTHRALFRLGISRKKQGRFSNALATLRRALILQEQTLPRNHPDLLKTREAIDAFRLGASDRSRTRMRGDPTVLHRE